MVNLPEISDLVLAKALAGSAHACARAPQLAMLHAAQIAGAGSPYAKGRNVAIEVRWGEGRSDRFSEIGHDTRALQAYLGHKNIRHTVHYTELAPDRFKDFWR